MRRSMLFLPGNTPGIIVNGEILGADALILDLEDAVAPTEKDSARILVRNAISRMGFGACEVIVRINAADTAYWQRDLEAIVPVKPALIVGVPVGFVNVVESKELICELDVPFIVARGRKGGSNVAAAICNALLYLASNNERE